MPSILRTTLFSLFVTGLNCLAMYVMLTYNVTGLFYILLPLNLIPLGVVWTLVGGPAIGWGGCSGCDEFLILFIAADWLYWFFVLVLIKKVRHVRRLRREQRAIERKNSDDY